MQTAHIASPRLWDRSTRRAIWHSAWRLSFLIFAWGLVLQRFWALPVVAAGSCERELPEDADPPEVAVGERLFLETRFAQFFFVHSQGDANAVLPVGDPVMDTTPTLGDPLPGPFAGQSMNCRNCHFVDEHATTLGGGVRTYADFARRSPVPQREDGKATTPRNSPPLVNASLARKGGVLFHFDAEFASLKDLIKATYTGRNFGWLPGEEQQAVAHIAHVIRNDDGAGALAQQAGGAYAKVLKGIDSTIPPEFCLPSSFRRVDFDRASDEEIFDTVAELVAAYVRSLTFTRDEERVFIASPYDVFLTKNNLPQKPEDETALAYSRRLRALIENLRDPQFVTSADGTLQLHAQDFVFGPEELTGFQLFFAEPDHPATSGGVGNCVACHMAPNFSDFAFHNTGATQEEYDATHGQGAFVALAIPDLKTRKADYNAFLPPTPAHPQASGRFFSPVFADRPELTDLGLWNIFANPDHPTPQGKIKQVLFRLHGRLPARKLLPKTIGVFKTPGLRDLGQSAPYLHTGGKDTLSDIIRFYINVAELARAGGMRNPDPEIGRIRLAPTDIAPLQAFLRALNEDYQ